MKELIFLTLRTENINNLEIPFHFNKFEFSLYLCLLNNLWLPLQNNMGTFLSVRIINQLIDDMKEKNSFLF